MPIAEDIESVYSYIGAYLEELRKIRGISLDDLAKLVDLSRPSIANIEAGRQRVQVHHLLQMCRVLNIDPAIMLHHALQDNPEI